MKKLIIIGLLALSACNSSKQMGIDPVYSTIYYRVKIVDTDSLVTYSKIDKIRSYE